MTNRSLLLFIKRQILRSMTQTPQTRRMGQAQTHPVTTHKKPKT